MRLEFTQPVASPCPLSISGFVVQITSQYFPLFQQAVRFKYKSFLTTQLPEQLAQHKTWQRFLLRSQSNSNFPHIRYGWKHTLVLSLLKKYRLQLTGYFTLTSLFKVLLWFLSKYPAKFISIAALPFLKVPINVGLFHVFKGMARSSPIANHFQLQKHWRTSIQVHPLKFLSNNFLNH